MMREVQDLWRSLRTNDDVRCVVLTGSGARAFCVGIDRNADDTYVVFEKRTLYGTSNNYMYDDPGRFLGPKSNDLWKPIICAVNGMACGGAFYMIAESDIVIAAEHATFFDPHVTYGQAAASLLELQRGVRSKPLSVARGLSRRAKQRYPRDRARLAETKRDRSRSLVHRSSLPGSATHSNGIQPTSRSMTNELPKDVNEQLKTLTSAPS
jgi:hypothetical protein